MLSQVKKFNYTSMGLFKIIACPSRHEKNVVMAFSEPRHANENIGTLSFQIKNKTFEYTVSSTHRLDFQCPSYIQNHQFLEIIKQTEEEYKSFLYNNKILLNKPHNKTLKVLLPGAGRLISFIPTLLEEGIESIICSDIRGRDTQISETVDAVNVHLENKLEYHFNKNALDHLAELNTSSFDLVILPWFSMYLQDDTDYKKLLSHAKRLLKTNGKIIERYSTEQAFGDQSVSLFTKFRSKSEVERIYIAAGLDIQKDIPIRSFQNYTSTGQRLLWAKERK